MNITLDILPYSFFTCLCPRVDHICYRFFDILALSASRPTSVASPTGPVVESGLEHSATSASDPLAVSSSSETHVRPPTGYPVSVDVLPPSGRIYPSGHDRPMGRFSSNAPAGDSFDWNSHLASDRDDAQRAHATLVDRSNQAWPRSLSLSGRQNTKASDEAVVRQSADQQAGRQWQPSSIPASGSRYSVPAAPGLVSHDLLCHRLNGLTAGQKQLCLSHPGLVWAMVDGTQLGLLECVHQFRGERWNCSAASVLYQFQQQQQEHTPPEHQLTGQMSELSQNQMGSDKEVVTTTKQATGVSRDSVNGLEGILQRGKRRHNSVSCINGPYKYPTN